MQHSELQGEHRAVTDPSQHRAVNMHHTDEQAQSSWNNRQQKTRRCKSTLLHWASDQDYKLSAAHTHSFLTTRQHFICLPAQQNRWWSSDSSEVGQAKVAPWGLCRSRARCSCFEHHLETVCCLLLSIRVGRTLWRPPGDWWWLVQLRL